VVQLHCSMGFLRENKDLAPHSLLQAQPCRPRGEIGLFHSSRQMRRWTVHVESPCRFAVCRQLQLQLEHPSYQSWPRVRQDGLPMRLGWYQILDMHNRRDCYCCLRVRRPQRPLFRSTGGWTLFSGWTRLLPNLCIQNYPQPLPTHFPQGPE
jgi:hypothetical protein